MLFYKTKKTINKLNNLAFPYGAGSPDKTNSSPSPSGKVGRRALASRDGRGQKIVTFFRLAFLSPIVKILLTLYFATFPEGESVLSFL